MDGNLIAVLALAIASVLIHATRLLSDAYYFGIKFDASDLLAADCHLHPGYLPRRCPLCATVGDEQYSRKP